jgi:hypothetical protein
LDQNAIIFNIDMALVRQGLPCIVACGGFFATEAEFGEKRDEQSIVPSK